VCEVVSRGGFDLHFPNEYDIEHLFMFVGYLDISFGEFLPIF